MENVLILDSLTESNNKDFAFFFPNLGLFTGFAYFAKRVRIFKPFKVVATRTEITAFTKLNNRNFAIVFESNSEIIMALSNSSCQFELILKLL